LVYLTTFSTVLVIQYRLYDYLEKEKDQGRLAQQRQFVSINVFSMSAGRLKQQHVPKAIDTVGRPASRLQCCSNCLLLARCVLMVLL
jgi:hypothetical protein